jgi:16S rRNA G966 N2-methylase RsmD
MDFDKKLYYLFGEKYELWEKVDKFLTYVTPYSVSQMVASLAKENYKKSKVLWDMFSGIGSDYVNFAEHFTMIGTEIDEEIFKCLSSNVQLSNHSEKNIIINADCCKAESDINADIVYFDPPWGSDFVSGEDFDFNKVKLDSNDQSVMNLAERIVEKYTNVIIKSPISSNSFDLKFKDRIRKRYLFSKQKIKFLFLSNKSEI